jgi:hypothetical protein
MDSRLRGNDGGVDALPHPLSLVVKHRIRRTACSQKQAFLLLMPSALSV